MRLKTWQHREYCIVVGAVAAELSLRWDSNSFFHFSHHYALLRKLILYNDTIMTSFVTIYDTCLDLQSKDAPDLNGRGQWEGFKRSP